MVDNIDRTMLVRAVISKIEDKGKPIKIEARDLEEYDTPVKIFTKAGNSPFMPDLAVYYYDELSLYEIELDKSMDIEKWRLMSLHAHKYKGLLYLVVPDTMKEKVKRELKEKKIEAGIIYFDTG